MSENSYQVLFLNLTSGSGAFNDRRPLGRRRTVTVSPREQMPTVRGRQTQAAIDAAARAVIARKGFLATTVVDIAAEAGKSAASFYNYYDSKESMVREWVQRFLADAHSSVRVAARPDLTNRERSQEAAAAYWYTYRSKLAEIVSVTELAMVNDDFAAYWTDLCALPTSVITKTIEHAQRDGYCKDDDPKLTALALVSMLNQFCYCKFTGDDSGGTVDDEACITTLANVFYRTIYHKEAGPT
jgi:AcrR family transcriptional regulator